MKKYIVTLTGVERQKLTQLIRSGKHGAQKLTRARILLKADQSPGAPAWIDKTIAQALDVGVATVERVRKRFVLEGLEVALNRRQERVPRMRRKLDGQQEAKLIALVCSTPPSGHARWSLRMLSEKLVELEIVAEISHETVRRTLKKIT